MYKSSNLCRSAICRRFVLLMGIWLGLLLGTYEIYRTSQAQGGASEGVRRMAVYGIVVRAQQ